MFHYNVKKGAVRMVAELLPCPFCGGQANFRAFASAIYGADGVIVRCMGCGASTKYWADVEVAEAVSIGMDAAAAAWNQRCKGGFIRSGAEI